MSEPSYESKTLTVSRLLNAPAELVWEVWTKPEHIKHWWGPNGFTNTIHEMNVVERGVWEFIMHGPDGTDYRNKNMFTHIVPMKKIVYEHQSAPKFTASITFESVGKQTQLTWKMEFESAAQLEQVVKVFKADVGLRQNVDKLEVHLTSLAKGEAPAGVVIVERVFKASPAVVWRALTDKDQMKQWYFDLKDFKPEVGFEFEFYGGTPEKQYLHRCKILEVEKEKKLAYTWRYPDYSGTSVVTFELAAEGNSTKLTLTHQGVNSFPADDPSFAKESFSKGWNYIVHTSLKGFLEK
jgi:uncharacterized protein YndB with AHSA1/START domain